MVKELKDQDWKAFSEAEYAVIDCYGENCFACVMLAPTYDAVADELPGVAFGRINVSFHPDMANTNNIDAMPTLLYFRRGVEVDRTIGSIDRNELLTHVAKLLYE